MSVWPYFHEPQASENMFGMLASVRTMVTLSCDNDMF